MVALVVVLQRRVRNHVMEAARWVGDEVANYSCHIMSLPLFVFAFSLRHFSNNAPVYFFREEVSIFSYYLSQIAGLPPEEGQGGRRRDGTQEEVGGVPEDGEKYWA